MPRADWDLPGTPGYERARRQFVGGDRDVLPVAVARCADADDVAAALRWAGSRGVPFAVRSGGHSYADHSSTAGLLIDVGELRAVRAAGDLVTVGAGASLGALSDALAPTGRTVPAGSCPTVGIAGIALAGGFGFLGRRYGLTCDHLVAARIVLADGQVLVVDAGREPDLFWALRGAGCGNFGVVTELVLRTRPVAPLTAFHAAWDFAEAGAVLDAWQRWAPYAPDDVTAEVAVTASDDPAEPPTVELFGTAGRPAAATAARLAPLAPAARVHELSTVDASRYLSGRLTRTLASAWVAEGPFERPGFIRVKSGFHAEPLPVPVIEDLLRRFAADRAPGLYRDLEFTPWRGAYARPAPDATAFVHRDPHYMISHTAVAGARATAAHRRAAREWTAGSWAVVRPYATGGVYPGYPDPDLTDWPEAYYGANLPRLRKVKAAYDPAGTFAFAQSLEL